MLSSPGNGFAYFMLFSWPLITIVIFRFLRLESAAIWSLLAGYLLLPAGTSLDLPLLPPINKFTITTFSTLLSCLIGGFTRPGSRPGLLISALALGYIFAPIAATFGNGYELRAGGLSVPGYYLIDGMKGSVNHVLQLGGFYVGLRFLRTPESHLRLLRALVVAALCYSLPALFEIRFSPQLHTWIYGYFPHTFEQQMRAGGFRPVVFLVHGLHVALFFTMALIGCCVFIRMRQKVAMVRPVAVVGYLTIILVLCKTLGASIYAGVFAPVLIFFQHKTSIRIASAVLLLVCAYPILRANDLSPTAMMQSVAASFSSQREASLDVRLVNEDMLLEKAMQKPAFGWGEWGRNRVFDTYSGRDISVTDGGWIITFGIYGWFGYLCLYGLLSIPVLRLNWTNIGNEQDALPLAGLSLILATNLLDTIPNDNVTAITFLIAGAIASRRGQASRRFKGQPKIEEHAKPQTRQGMTV